MGRVHTTNTLKLPVAQTVRASYTFVFANVGHLLALAATPLAITIVGETLISYVTGGLITELSESFGPGAAEAFKLVVGFLVIFVPWLIFVVAWHRFVLLGNRDTVRPVEFYFATRAPSIFKHDLFLAFLFAGCFVVFVVSSAYILDFPPNVYSSPLPCNIITLTFILLIDVRSLFLLPANAVGHKTTAGQAWRQSKGIALRLICILFLVVLPFNILHILILWMGVSGTVGGGLVVGEIVTFGGLLLMISGGLVLFLGTAVLVAALCLSYQHAVFGQDQAKAEVIRASEWIIDFLLPSMLALVLGGVGYLVAEMLGLAVREQVLLAAAAFLSTMGWNLYRLELKYR